MRTVEPNNGLLSAAETNPTQIVLAFDDNRSRPGREINHAVSAQHLHEPCGDRRLAGE